MRFARTLPPAAAPMGPLDILSGIGAALNQRGSCERFRAELASEFGVEHCFLVSSGKAALTLALLALWKLYPDRDEVVIPAFTCYSVPAAILRAGLKVRLCDVDAANLDFDFKQLAVMLQGHGRHTCDDQLEIAPDVELRPEKTAPPNTSCKILAVVPTHLFGLPSDVSRLRALIQGTEISIVEDAAQAMGEYSGQQKLGTLGDIGFFSLDRGKALSTVEGGIIVTNRGDIALALEQLVFGLQKYSACQQLVLCAKAIAIVLFIRPCLYWIPKAIPQLKLGTTKFECQFAMLQMSEFQAGMARNWNLRLRSVRALRMKNAKLWAAALSPLGTSKCRTWQTSDRGPIRLPIEICDPKLRDRLLELSEKHGIGIACSYPTSIDRIPALAKHVIGGPFTNAGRLAAGLVTFPTHAFVQPSDIEKPLQIFAHAQREGSGTGT